MTACLKKLFGLNKVEHCTHCGRSEKLMYISSYYSCFAPSIEYPAKDRPSDINFLCDVCWAETLDNYYGNDRFVFLAKEVGFVAHTFKEIAEEKRIKEKQ